jgi:glyoxylase-like metal-dependent hydrolase (beta-lactamase superfamily II)
LDVAAKSSTAGSIILRPSNRRLERETEDRRQEEAAMNLQTNTSLNNAALAGRPGPEDLVPSRYALQVGEIEVLVISDGVFSLPAATLATNAAPAELAAWLDKRFQRPDVYKWPLNVVVVRSGGRTVLIDAGIGEEYPDVPRAGGLLAQRLDAAGIDPASVTDVVLSHLHVDHVGGLLADGLAGRLRPDVPIHVAAAEVEFWASPDFSRNAFPQGMPEVLRSAARRFVDKYRGQLRLFETEQEVAPGVIVRRTGGHTPGHCVVRLASGGERLTFLGDAVFPDHFDRPDWYNAFDHDPQEAVRVRVNLLRELAATREPLLATHLSFPSAGRVAVAGDVFRFVPADWEY